MSGGRPNLAQRAARFLAVDVWRPREGAGRVEGWAQRMLQGLIAVGEGLREDLVPLRASALTAYTVLSLVPLLAVAAAIASAVGIRDLLPPLVEPIARVSPEMAGVVLGALERFDFGSLGTLGAVMLVATTLLGIGSIERALNAVWGVRRVRPLRRRIPDYLAVLVVSPLLLGVALSLDVRGVMAELNSPPWARTAYGIVVQVAPLALYWAGFSFLFWFMPNTQVRPRAASLGGAVAALAFVGVSELYVDLQIGVVRASALFGGLAAFPITVVWIHVSWVIVLVGAECAYVNQNLVQMRSARVGAEYGPAARETIGIAIAVRVARAFIADGRAPSLEEISQSLEVHARAVRTAVADLERAGILAPRGDPSDEVYQLARAPEQVALEDVLRALRGGREPDGSLGDLRSGVLRVLREHDEKAAAALAGRTLADLAIDDRPTRA